MLEPVVAARNSTAATLLPHDRRSEEGFPEAAGPGSSLGGRARLLLGEIWHGCWQAQTWTRAARVRLLVVFLVAAVCSWTGIVLSRQSEGVATIWLSNGILFGLLITQPRKQWLAYFIAGLVADTAADMVYGDPFRVAFGVSLANSIEVITSTLVLTLWFGSPLRLYKRQPLVGFLLVAVLGATAVASALGASWTLHVYPGEPWWKMFRTWYLGDMLGMAIFAPLLVVVQRPAFFTFLRREQLGHTLLVISVPVLAAVLVFTHSKDPLIFFLFPVLLLVAFRLGFPGTVVALSLVMLLVIGFTIKGHGPLMLIRGEQMLLHRIVIAQIFLATGIFTMFPVSALLEEKEALRISLELSEARFRELAHGDELTGLFNRRAFNLRLEQAWKEALMSGVPLALLLLDADHFKQYNDMHGHLRGDDCLRILGEVIRTAVGRHGGTPARFGGEEFAVLLPDTDLEHARVIAEEIRQNTVAQRLKHPSSPSGVQTVSVGVAAFVPEPGRRPSDLLRIADEALYQAKVSGRNQVACAHLVVAA